MNSEEAVGGALDQATGARKCHGCGCFQDAVTALEDSALGVPLRARLSAARARFRERTQDCLGCAICWPADALNLAAELVELPAGVGCAAALAQIRAGWPPYPGDYQVGAYGGTVAVCTLHSRDLVAEIARRNPSGLAIVGSLQTENLGIERLVQNVVANPTIRRLLVCGEDTAGRVGHLPGQSLLALVRAGVGKNGRINAAEGRRPMLENLEGAWVDAFRQQIEVVDRRGLCDPDELAALVTELAGDCPGPAPAHHGLRAAVRTVRARPPRSLILDPAGYVVVYVDVRRRRLVAEHYGNSGTIGAVVEGTSADEIVATLIAEGLVSRLDHAAYLGKQLALAELALAQGTAYRQDGAPEPSPCCGGGGSGSCGC